MADDISIVNMFEDEDGIIRGRSANNENSPDEIQLFSFYEDDDCHCLRMRGNRPDGIGKASIFENSTSGILQARTKQYQWCAVPPTSGTTIDISITGSRTVSEGVCRYIWPNPCSSRSPAEYTYTKSWTATGTHTLVQSNYSYGGGVKMWEFNGAINTSGSSTSGTWPTVLSDNGIPSSVLSLGDQLGLFVALYILDGDEEHWYWYHRLTYPYQQFDWCKHGSGVMYEPSENVNCSWVYTLPYPDDHIYFALEHDYIGTISYHVTSTSWD